jgi:Tfp pilus assembly protein PilF
MRKEVVTLFCAMLAAISISSAQSKPSAQQQIQEHKRLAAEYLQEKKLDLAASEFRSILSLNPQDAESRGNLGVVLFFEQKYADAIPELQEALSQRPTIWKIQALLGIAEKRTGDLEHARLNLEKAFPKVAEENIKVETGMELIEIYSASRELDMAGAVIKVLRDLRPTDEAIQYSAYRVYSDLANESLLSLTIVAPNSARTHQAMAHEFAERGETPQAIEHYRAALKINPQLPGLHFELGDLLRTSGSKNQAEAESEYKAALQVNPKDEQALCRLGEISLLGNNLDEANQRFSKALQLQPNDPEASIGAAKVAMAMQNLKKAETFLVHAIQLDPTSAVAHFRLGTVYRQLGRTADAQNEIEQYKKYKNMQEKLQELYHKTGAEAVEEERTEPR